MPRRKPWPNTWRIRRLNRASTRSSRAVRLHHGLTHVYCSLMTRSILTAEYIARACDLPLEAMPDTFEKYGVYEFDHNRERQGLPGQDRAYFEARFPDLKLPEDLNENGWWNRPAEDETGFLWRMRDVVERFKQRLHDSDETVALVAAR